MGRKRRSKGKQQSPRCKEKGRHVRGTERKRIGWDRIGCDRKGKERNVKEKKGKERKGKEEEEDAAQRP